MTRQAELSPNIPDIAPDYVDSPSSATAVAEAPQPNASQFRQDECIPNTPDVQPDIVPDSRATQKPTTTTQEASSQPTPSGTAKPHWFRWDIVTLVLVVSLFGAMVFSQAISALAMASTLPVWVQYALLIPLALFCLGILFFCASVLAAWFRLRAVRQIDIAALDDLRRRAQTRKDGVEHLQAARNELEDYLARYPLTAENQDRLATAGITLETLELLTRERDRLANLAVDSRSWLGNFQTTFQSHLDKAAQGRIRRWSITAAGCAMASPIPLLDAFLILGVSMKMIKDLCFIYNVRSGRSSSFILFTRAITAAFIAGFAEDAMTAATDAAGEELTGVFGESALSGLGAGMAKAVAPKLGEGAINAFFINRLGKATVRLLQPLKPVK